MSMNTMNFVKSISRIRDNDTAPRTCYALFLQSINSFDFLFHPDETEFAWQCSIYDNSCSLCNSSGGTKLLRLNNFKNFPSIFQRRKLFSQITDFYDHENSYFLWTLFKNRDLNGWSFYLLNIKINTVFEVYLYMYIFVFYAQATQTLKNIMS